MRFKYVSDMKDETHWSASDLCARVTFNVLTPLQRRDEINYRIIISLGESDAVRSPCYIVDGGDGE